MQQGGFMNSSQLSNASLFSPAKPLIGIVVLLVHAFHGGAEPTGIQRGKAAFMEHSAEPYFNVWASVVLCPFLDLNVYP